MGRDPKHDYRGRCLYHITIGKAPGCPDFSHICGSPRQLIVERTPIGEIIESQIIDMPNICSYLKILQYVIMPDHIHIALFATAYLPRVLGRYIGILKVRCGQLVRERYPKIKDVFTKDFHDRYLRPSHSLQSVIDYIRQNPYRLIVRRYNPDFFRRINNIEIAGALWQAYGNIQLLENPFKAPVVIHRADSEAVRAAKRRRWKHLAENGGVLVSAFISPDEKAIRQLCEEADGRMVLLSTRPFAEREKPTAHDFELCSRGRLLILAPMQELPSGRRTFLYLNSIAETIGLPSSASR